MKDYDKHIKSLVTPHHYNTICTEHGVTTLNDLNETYLNRMVSELMRQIDGMK